MRHIYTDASAVLVLDKTLQQVSTDTGTLSTMWQIYTSIWYRHLWTLQEGVLNSRTLVLLSDDLPTFEWFVHSYDACLTLELHLKEYRKYFKANSYDSRTADLTPYSTQLLDPAYRHLRLDLLETRRTIIDPDHYASRLFFHHVWRDTSVRSDESICIAVLTSYPITFSFLEKSVSSQLATVIRHLELTSSFSPAHAFPSPAAVECRSLSLTRILFQHAPGPFTWPKSHRTAS